MIHFIGTWQNGIFKDKGFGIKGAPGKEI